MTEKSPASVAHVEQAPATPLAGPSGTSVVQPGTQPAASPTESFRDSSDEGMNHTGARPPLTKARSMVGQCSLAMTPSHSLIGSVSAISSS
jgi:hypothetical protein